MAVRTDHNKPAVSVEHVRAYAEDMLDALAKLAAASGQRRLATTLQTAALEAARRAEPLSNPHPVTGTPAIQGWPTKTAA